MPSRGRAVLNGEHGPLAQCVHLHQRHWASEAGSQMEPPGQGTLPPDPVHITGCVQGTLGASVRGRTLGVAGPAALGAFSSLQSNPWIMSCFCGSEKDNLHPWSACRGPGSTTKHSACIAHFLFTTIFGARGAPAPVSR